MEFKNYLNSNAQNIEKELNKILLKFSKEAKQIDSQLSPFAQKFVDACKGGKKIRGVLVKLGYELAGGKSNEIHKISAAIEILHTAILVHDDVIDKSDMRRGKESLHKALGGDHNGISFAIVLGDIGLYLPIKIIADSNFSNELKLKVLSYLSQTIINTGWGQVLDIKKTDNLMLLYKLKTAYYTICGPLILGSLLAGTNNKTIRVLRDFGLNLGIAFQIQDNILDGEKGSLNSALKFVTLSKKLIPKITTDIKMKKVLEKMANYLVERTK